MPSLGAHAGYPDDFAIQARNKTSERFGDCEWLPAADADGFLDKSMLTLQRTDAGSCMIFDRETL